MARLRTRPTIPAQFRVIAMTDRDDGRVWALLNQTDGDYIKLVTPPPSGFRGDTFAEREGPWMESRFGHVRLFVRGGRLGFDRPGVDVSTRPVLAPDKVRARETDVFMELFFPDEQGANERLAYKVDV